MDTYVVYYIGLRIFFCFFSFILLLTTFLFSFCHCMCVWFCIFVLHIYKYKDSYNQFLLWRGSVEGIVHRVWPRGKELNFVCNLSSWMNCVFVMYDYDDVILYVTIFFIHESYNEEYLSINNNIFILISSYFSIILLDELFSIRTF